MRYLFNILSVLARLIYFHNAFCTQKQFKKVKETSEIYLKQSIEIYKYNKEPKIGIKYFVLDVVCVILYVFYFIVYINVSIL